MGYKDRNIHLDADISKWNCDNIHTHMGTKGTCTCVKDCFPSTLQVVLGPNKGM